MAIRLTAIRYAQRKHLQMTNRQRPRFPQWGLASHRRPAYPPRTPRSDSPDVSYGNRGTPVWPPVLPPTQQQA